MDNNNAGAQYYDDIYSNWISDDLTKKEIEFIETLIPEDGSVMDLGCGTGRHLIELDKKGIDILGVDLAENMLATLKSKYPKAKVLKANIYEDKIEKKFDVIMLVWNAVMEIAQTEEDLSKLFEILKSLLKDNGKILMVNLYNESEPTNSGLDLVHETTKNEQKFRLTWRILDFLEKENVTVCEEKIELLDINNEITKTVVSTLKQKWWRKAELEKAGEKVGLKLKEFKIDGSEYQYYLFDVARN